MWGQFRTPGMFYGLLSGYFLTKIAFPDIDILHPAVLSVPPKTMCLYNYYIAYVREGTILKVAIICEQQKTKAKILLDLL